MEEEEGGEEGGEEGEEGEEGGEEGGGRERGEVGLGKLGERARVRGGELEGGEKEV